MVSLSYGLISQWQIINREHSHLNNTHDIFISDLKDNFVGFHTGIFSLLFSCELVQLVKATAGIPCFVVKSDHFVKAAETLLRVLFSHPNHVPTLLGPVHAIRTIMAAC